MSLERTNRPSSRTKSPTDSGADRPVQELVLDVADVELATVPLEERAYKDQVEAKLQHVTDASQASDIPTRPVEACSKLQGSLVPSVKNSLLVAAYHAFTTHRPLVLSPDILWLAIVQGFAEHVNQNAEELRHEFVAHQGQLELKVWRNEFQKGSPENDWPGVFDEFSRQMRQHLGDSTHEMLTPRFSTTGPVERAAALIAMFDAFRQYFKFTVFTICGIPQVVLQGTKEDWVDLYERTEQISALGPRGWARSLLFVLGHFIAVHEGRFHQPFWESLYKFGNMCGKEAVARGWINVFFPYLATGKTNPVIMGLREEWHDPDNFPNLSRHIWPDIMDFPLGLSRVPFRWVYGDQEFAMEWLAGFIGITQDRETMRLRPEIGWAVRDVTPSAN